MTRGERDAKMATEEVLSVARFFVVSHRIWRFKHSDVVRQSKMEIGEDLEDDLGRDTGVD